MCEAAGDVVQLDDADYVCTKDDVLTDVGPTTIITTMIAVYLFVKLGQT